MEHGMEGPASMELNDGGLHIQDIVSAFNCDCIPRADLEWMLRKRPYQWPTKDQLESMSRMGCFVVQAGHAFSSEKGVEWRLSYTLQERCLMSSLNPVQHRVYVLLKMVKKNILVNLFPGETLSSYHFKTCVLYAVQMTPAHVWTPNNLINCLLQCLMLMTRWLSFSYCPSYLVSGQNLFLKEGFSDIRKGVLAELRRLLQSDTKFLYMLQSDNVGTILKNGDWRMYREITEDNKLRYRCNLQDICTSMIDYEGFCVVRFLCGERYDPVTLSCVIAHLQSVKHFDYLTMEETRSVLSQLFPWCHLQIGLSLASIAYACKDQADRQRVMRIADGHFQQTRGTYLLNERFAVATVLYTFEKYEECFLLLQQIENDFAHRWERRCQCIGKGTGLVYCGDGDLREALKRKARMSITQHIKSMTTCCIQFLPSAMAIVPVPLHYEMKRSQGPRPGSQNDRYDSWLYWVCVDPKIYLYFIQYLVSKKLHKEQNVRFARDHLQSEIVEDDQRVTAGRRSWLFHKETAYNLLGWIHMLENRLDEACLCFVASWKLRPYHNAAKYHMIDLLARL